MRLVRTDANGHGESFDLAGDSLIVGRLTHRGLQIEHPTVSREHARFFARDGVWQLADLNSSNGTFVNGAQITKATLKPGDIVKLGDVELRLDDGTKAAPAGVAVGESDEITLDDDFFETAKPATATSAISPAAPANPNAARPARPAPAPLSTSASSMAAPPPKRLSTKNLTRKSDEKASGGVLGNDIAQYGGAMKFVIVVACLAVAYGIYLGAMKLTETVVPERSAIPATADAGDADASNDAGK